MPRIIFVEHDGTEHEVELETGKSLMQLATDNLVPGIDADCGGECACGTCHVMLDEKSYAAAGALADDERQMLEMTPDHSATSRLACQIQVTDQFDGLMVRLPEFQM